MFAFLRIQRQKLEQCVEFETRKLQELQSTFESDWIEFRNNQKTRKLVRIFFRFFSMMVRREKILFFFSLQSTIIISLSLVQIDQFHIHSPPGLSMTMPSQNNENHSRYIENKNQCQTFVYNADEVSLEALLDPKFRPMSTYEQPPPPPTMFYSNNNNNTYHRPQRSWSTTRQLNHYERASFDPYADLGNNQVFSTIPTRRRHYHHPTLNDISIVHL